MKTYLAIPFLVLALSGCGYFTAEKPEEKFARCPTAAIVADGQGYIDTPGDAWQVRAQMDEFDTRCALTSEAAEVTLTAKVTAERSGDTAEAKEFLLPIFIAVVEDGKVIAKNVETVSFAFAKDISMAKREKTLEATLPFNEAGTAANRRVYLSFQLTPEQLTFFRKLREDRAQSATDAPATK
jgi:hypothetical protein